MTTATKPRAGIYVRISDDHMGSGLGVARQEEDCRKLAESRGWVVVEVFSDNDRSAYDRRKPRAQYARMLDAIKNREIDVVIAWHPDRLHRQLRELVPFIDLVNDYGTGVETVRAGVYDLSTPSGRMQAQIAGAVAEHESAHKSERIKRKLEQNAAEGRHHGGSRPYGWQSDRVSLDPDEAAHLRWATEQALAGISMRGLAQALNARGSVSATGKQWGAVQIRDALLRPRNAGIRVHHGEEVGKGDWEPIISEEDFRQLQALLLNPTRVTNPGKSGKVHLLSVTARCGVCGSPMVVGLGKKYKGKAKPIYRCGNREKSHVSRDQEALDRFVTRLVIARMRKADVRELMATSASRTKKARENTRAIQEIESRLNDAAEAFAAGSITMAQLTTINTSLRPRLDALKAESVAPDRARALGELIEAPDPEVVWERWTPEKRRTAVALLMEVRVLPMGRRTALFDPSSVEIEWRNPN